ncbi:MAG TPA: FliM/FliN family flagellar motor switch protein [Phycisphaerae bacterium]|nr:FliM/FliN family flagellar motor switch protein [Phycisphaerae bacterium]
MSFMDQSSVDALLAQVQAEAEAVASGATPADAGAVSRAAEHAAAVANEIAGGAPSAGHSVSAELPDTPEVHRLLAIEVPVIVRLGMRRLTVGEVMRLGVGAIIEFNKSAEEELDLLANNKEIGKGHAVKVGENFGVKISSIGTVKETIRKLGGG